MSTQLVQRYNADVEKINPLELVQRVSTARAEAMKIMKEMEP